MVTRLTMAKSEIVSLFDSQINPVFKRNQIGRLFEEHRTAWRLPKYLSLNKFIEYLISYSKMKRRRIMLPHRPETLFTWGNVSMFNMASSLKKGGYLSHYTAMQFHELTSQIPEILYVNHEQRTQPRPSGNLTQESVSRAFRNKQRASKNITQMGRRKVCVRNGKNTGRLGVIELEDQYGHPVEVTNLERTLIDITIRPSYSGGVEEVLEAYRRAADSLQVNSMLAMLKKMDFIYPYTQSIGFYMDHCKAYPIRRLEMISRDQFELDFYLAYKMKETSYSKRWRIFYPKGL